MTRTPLLAVLAAAVFAAPALADTRRIDWDQKSFGTPGLRDLIVGEPTPRTPPSAPAVPAEPADPKTAASCPDGAALQGLAFKLALTLDGQDVPRFLVFTYDGCRAETPRDEPPAAPYTYRAYKSSKGDVLSLYSSSEKPTTNVSLSLADGSSAATALPIFSNSDLASGRALELGDFLVVRIGKDDRGATVVRAKGALAAIPAK